MANLSDFLGGLVSSFSNARRQSDYLSLDIANEYAGDEMLKNFAIPRMRIQDVEITIPVALDKLTELTSQKFGPLDKVALSSKVNEQILLSLEMSSIPPEVTKLLKPGIEKQLKILEDQLQNKSREEAVGDFTKSISSIVLGQKDLLYKDNIEKLGDTKFQSKLQEVIATRLEQTLHNEIQPTIINTGIFKQDFIVEANKLREIMPNNIMTIKMKISEVGMEWVKMENKEGEIVSKLLPE